MGTLSNKAKAIEDKTRLAVKNVPAYARHLPGVDDALRILGETVALLREITDHIEAGK